MTIPFEEIAAKLLEDPAVKAEYDRLAPEFEALAEQMRARQRASLSKAELAKRKRTHKSATARPATPRS